MERAPPPRYASTLGTSTSATAGSVFSPPNGEPGRKGRALIDRLIHRVIHGFLVNGGRT